MLLFSETQTLTNLLPCDGEVLYYGPIFDPASSEFYFKHFLETIPFKNDQGTIAGKAYVSNRKVCWFDQNNLSYKYSNADHESHFFTKEILEIKEIVEDKTQTKYNACLFNLYEDGNVGVGWHSDKEARMARFSSIASVSFGAERRFDFRHLTKDLSLSTYLEHGSLLLMKGVTQNHWKHQLAKSKKILTPRINITFRQAIS